MPILLYPLAKRVTNWPQAMLGLIFAWAAPEGIAAATGRMDAVALLLWAAGFCGSSATTRSMPTRTARTMRGRHRQHRAAFGERTRPFLAACYAGVSAVLALAGWVAGLSWFYPGLLLPAALLARQVLTLDIHDPGHCLRLFKANREVGLAMALAFLLGRL